MIFYCVEPAHVDVNKDFHDWKFTMRTGFGHHIAFPHVDSCLGVVCQLPGGRVFAGHINGFYQGDFSPQSHQNAFQGLLQELHGAVPLSVAIFGNVGDGNQHAGWLDFIAFPWANRIEFVSASCPQGVDVMFDVDSGHLKVMRHLPNRDFRMVPSPLPVGQADVYTPAGYQVVNC